jgi:hypothetical protein
MWLLTRRLCTMIALQTSPRPGPRAPAAHPQSSALTPQNTSGRSRSGSSSALAPRAAAAAPAGAAAARHPPFAAGVGTPLGRPRPAARCHMPPPSTAAAGVTGGCRVLQVAPCAAAATAGHLARGPLKGPVLAGTTALAAAAGAAPTTTAVAATWAGLAVLPDSSCSSGPAAAPAAGTGWGQSTALAQCGAAAGAAAGSARTGCQTETHWHQVGGCM